MACDDVTAMRWSWDQDTALTSVVDLVRATQLLAFLLMAS